MSFQTRMILLLLAFVAFTQGLEITGSIPASNPHLANPAFLPPSTTLILSAHNRQYKTHPSSSGKFTFRNVTAGPSYLLQVECLTHSFPSLRIDTQNEDVEVYQTFKGNEWSHRGAKLAYPIQLAPSSTADYYIVSTCSQSKLISGTVRIQNRLSFQKPDDPIGVILLSDGLRSTKDDGFARLCMLRQS